MAQNTQQLTGGKPVSPEVVRDADGDVVAAHQTTVVLDPESAEAVQVPSHEENPEANATGANPLEAQDTDGPLDRYNTDQPADVNEVQRIDPTGTVSGGTYDFVLAPGTAYETAFTEVAFDATVAEINALIVAEADLVDAEGNPNVVASGVGVDSGNLDFTFQNELGGQNVPELTVDDTDITGGGTLAAATVTAGLAAH